MASGDNEYHLTSSIRSRSLASLKSARASQVPTAQFQFHPNPKDNFLPSEPVFIGDLIKGRNKIVVDLSLSPQGLRIKVSQLGNVSSFQ